MEPAGTRAAGPIPAGTGETAMGVLAGDTGRAYPRRHGGNFFNACELLKVPGLSPQARGKHIRLLFLKVGKGPIPAGTGETRGQCRHNGISRAYPRRHGGNPIPEGITEVLEGLSPQARGKLT